MRTVAFVALSVLTLAGSVAGTEARGFRLRGTSVSAPFRRTSAPDAAARRAVAVVGSIGSARQGDVDGPPGTKPVARSVITAEASAPGAETTEPAIPPMPPAPAAVRKAAEPWCPSGRIAGQGTGFCLIN